MSKSMTPEERKRYEDEQKERCADFLLEMIKKYGGQIEQEKKTA